MMKDLNSLEPHKIYKSSIHTVENILKTDKVAFYLFNPATGELHLQDKSEYFEMDEFIIVEQEAHFTEVLKSGETFINKTLEKSCPSVIVPVHINGTVLGVITVDGLGFEQLSLFYINMLNTLGDLISSSLKCAYEHQRLMENKGENNRMSNKVIANV